MNKYIYFYMLVLSFGSSDDMPGIILEWYAKRYAEAIICGLT